MKRYYYNVSEFTLESEFELGQSQLSNDMELIAILFHTYKLDPMYTESVRDKHKIDFNGHIQYQFYNWEGDKLEWVKHTLELFNREYERVKDHEKFKSYDSEDILEIIAWLENEKEKIIEKEPGDSMEKIKWNGRPAQIGYLFKELVNKGWITVPMTNQKESVKKLSRLCQQYFDVKTESPESFYHEFLKSNSLTFGGESFFKLKEMKE